MTKAIYKQLDNPEDPIYMIQQFINDNEKAPEGWTENLEDIPKPEWEENE